MSIASAATKCPRCGGEVASAVARRAVSDGAYKMDE
jgi:PHP family Zn ribbon phosphoesterase